MSQPHMMVVGELDEVFLPCPDDLLANLQVPLACLRLAVCPLIP